MDSIARTIVGHVHAPGFLAVHKMLRHLPVSRLQYPIVRIASHGAQGARLWKQFRLKVCPSTYGVGNHLAGGVLLMQTNGNGSLRAYRRRINHRAP
jgi:hypothetical protein